MVLKAIDGWLKKPVAAVGVFLLCLSPMLWLVLNALLGDLGADPAKTIVKELGFWAAVLLWVSLLSSSLSRRVKIAFLLRRRRMLGLFAFFYALIHLLSYLTFILGWRWDLIGNELTKRPYIVVGMVAVLLLVPLALTSTKRAQKALGRSWKRLHQLVYPAALLVLIHIIWMVRASYLEALIFSVCLGLLFIERFAASKKI